VHDENVSVLSIKTILISEEGLEHFGIIMDMKSGRKSSSGKNRRWEEEENE